MSSTNTYLTCVSPSNLTGVYPFLGMYTIASLRPGFAQSLKIILLDSLLPHRTRQAPYWSLQLTRYYLTALAT